MARDARPSVALLSIQPRFAERILAGSKTVEFRKKAFSADVEHVVVYASSPTQRVLGFFRVADVMIDSPTRLWTAVGERGGITKREFTDYYAGHVQGAAILVGQLWRLRQPLALQRLGVPKVQPPQSFRYLPSASLERLRRLAELQRPRGPADLPSSRSADEE